MAKKPQSEPEDTKQLTITVPATLIPKLDEHARKERRSRSNAAAVLLQDALDAKAAT